MDLLEIDVNRQIIPPADFPVVWAEPQDAAYHWTRDREHGPLPVTPMYSSVAELTAGAGYRTAVTLYEESVLRRHDRTINGYDYTRLDVFDPGIRANFSIVSGCPPPIFLWGKCRHAAAEGQVAAGACNAKSTCP